MENSDESKKNTQQELKHLGFVRVAAINTIICLSSVYDYAKQNSGPLRSAVGSFENAVTTVVTPVYNKFKDIPDRFLVFLDEKVDVACARFDEHAPPLAKQVATKVHTVLEQTAQLAKEAIDQAKEGGPLVAAQFVANESKEVVLKESVKVWSKLDQIPPFHMVAEMTVPTAAHWSEKYNKVISDLRGNGHAVFNYVPMVPIDEISKAFKQVKGGNEGDAANSTGEAASSQ